MGYQPVMTQNVNMQGYGQVGMTYPTAYGQNYAMGNPPMMIPNQNPQIIYTNQNNQMMIGGAPIVQGQPVDGQNYGTNYYKST